METGKDLRTDLHGPVYGGSYGDPGGQRGRSVTLVGRDGNQEITMEELAEISGGFHYEIPCLIGKRVPRRYVKNGKEVGGMMCRDEEYEGF